MTLTPTGPKQWHLQGVATFAELFERGDVHTSCGVPKHSELETGFGLAPEPCGTVIRCYSRRG